VLCWRLWRVLAGFSPKFTGPKIGLAVCANLAQHTHMNEVDPSKLVEVLGGPRAAGRTLNMSSSTLSRFQRHGFSQGFPWSEYFQLKIAAGELDVKPEDVFRKAE
jgi:hypothetical protein